LRRTRTLEGFVFNIKPFALMSDPAAVAQALDHAQTILRVGRPEDIASMVLYLASDESQWVTGTAMIVDGGITLGPNLSAVSAQRSEPPPNVYVGPSFKR
jgi:NAD(P)-dependent dehydrogenase (short-subunit alcohol dehydrogenase family)